MKISICITVKNRSKVEVEGRELILFPNCIKSIVDSVQPSTDYEVVVADWQSDDWPLNDWLEKSAAPVSVNLVQIEGPFNRGKGRNVATHGATGDYLFFLDADCTICPELLEIGLKSMKAGKAFFPVVYSFNTPEHVSGSWSHFGYGNCMIKKEMLDLIGGWPEYSSWGKEDDHFYEKIATLTEVVREEVPGFFHQWHPDDLIWKNRYAEKADEIANEIRAVITAKEEIASVIPEGASYIIIDESRFGGSDCVPGRKDFQFPEIDGEYGGAPDDSEVAIKEFERLYEKGASFIVFAWMAFWWLDYYLEFNQYLRSNFSCIFRK